MLRTLMNTTLAAGFAALASIAQAENYPTPVPLNEGAQAAIDAIAPKNDTFRIAYMPPATEFNYYIAIGEGIKAVAAEKGVEVFMLAPQSG
ncbi:MAG: sugar ABC transporter substrate-binding protein, partial [Paracoccaceae bacterium]